MICEIISTHVCCNDSATVIIMFNGLMQLNIHVYALQQVYCRFLWKVLLNIYFCDETSNFFHAHNLELAQPIISKVKTGNGSIS